MSVVALALITCIVALGICNKCVGGGDHSCSLCSGCRMQLKLGISPWVELTSISFVSMRGTHGASARPGKRGDSSV
jgi:hypothetical protein